MTAQMGRSRKGTKSLEGQTVIFEWASVAFTGQKLNFLFSGATFHIPLSKSATLNSLLDCSLWQFSGALFKIFSRAPFLHYGGKIARSPCVFFPWAFFNICLSPALSIGLNLTLKSNPKAILLISWLQCVFVSAAYQEGDVAGPDRIRPDIHQAAVQGGRGGERQTSGSHPGHAHHISEWDWRAC